MTDPTKPYTKVGLYFIRVNNSDDKKLMEISSPFNRTDTHQIAEALVSSNHVLADPNNNSAYTIVQNMKSMEPQAEYKNQFPTGYDLFIHICNLVGKENIDNAKCGLVTFDTKLNPWNPERV